MGKIELILGSNLLWKKLIGFQKDKQVVWSLVEEKELSFT
jgi:hypothetical protein